MYNLDSRTYKYNKRIQELKATNKKATNKDEEKKEVKNIKEKILKTEALKIELTRGIENPRKLKRIINNSIMFADWSAQSVGWGSRSSGCQPNIVWRWRARGRHSHSTLGIKVQFQSVSSLLCIWDSEVGHLSLQNLQGDLFSTLRRPPCPR